MVALPKDVAAKAATADERERITKLLDHAKAIGIRDLHLIDYIYLVERIRRWYSSAYAIGMVTPFLSPGFVAATFALTVEQKRARLLHTRLIGRLVPEWSEVPFVSMSTGVSTATRVWDGDGVRVIADLLDTAHGPITQMVRRDAVEKVLTTAVREDRADPRALRQFTWLAVASEQLEPGTSRPVTSATYARVTAPPKPPAKRRRSRLRRLKKTRLWKALRRKFR
jgi:asparagine synthase (glutamine-hydrolysing)